MSTFERPSSSSSRSPSPSSSRPALGRLETRPASSGTTHAGPASAAATLESSVGLSPVKTVRRRGSEQGDRQPIGPGGTVGAGAGRRQTSPVNNVNPAGLPRRPVLNGPSHSAASGPAPTAGGGISSLGKGFPPSNRSSSRPYDPSPFTDARDEFDDIPVSSSHASRPEDADPSGALYATSPPPDTPSFPAMTLPSSMNRPRSRSFINSNGHHPYSEKKPWANQGSSTRNPLKALGRWTASFRSTGQLNGATNGSAYNATGTSWHDKDSSTPHSAARHRYTAATASSTHLKGGPNSPVNGFARGGEPPWKRAGGWKGRRSWGKWGAGMAFLTLVVWMLNGRTNPFSSQMDPTYINPDLFADRPSISRRLNLNLDVSGLIGSGSSSSSVSRLLEPFISSRPAPHSHSFAGLIALPSSLDSRAPTELPTIGVVLHFPTVDKLASLEHLLTSLSAQNLLPSAVAVVCPRLLASGCRNALDRVVPMEEASLAAEAFEPARIEVADYVPVAGSSTSATEAMIRQALDLRTLTTTNPVTGEGAELKPVDFVVVIEGVLMGTKYPGLELGKGWLSNLVRSMGTKEYGSALLSSAGVAFDARSSGSRQAGHCLVEKPAALLAPAVSDHEDQDEPMDVRWTTLQTGAAAVQIPSSPLIVRTSWLELLFRRQGVQDPDAGTGTGLIRPDLPPASALGLALWQHARIPSFAIPFGGRKSNLPEETVDLSRGPFSGLGDSYVEGLGLEQGCLDVLTGLRKSAQGTAESEVANLFRPPEEARDQQQQFVQQHATHLSDHAAAAIQRESASSSRDNGSSKKLDPNGRIAIFTSSTDELNHTLRWLACGLARRHELIVYVTPSEDEDGDGKLEKIVYKLGRTASVCEIRTIPLQQSTMTVPSLEKRLKAGMPAVPSGKDTKSSSFSGKFDLVLYVKDTVDPVVVGALRRLDAVMEHERSKPGETPRLTAIGLPENEVEYVEWMTALPIQALQHWHTPRFDISVITNDRPYSLARLLTALQSTVYLGDKVHLSLQLEQTADLATQALLDDFQWRHGTLTTRHRVVLGGLMPAIVESWYPSHNDSYGVILEDDVEVSPLYYSWLKFTVLHYRYSPAQRERSKRLFGVSLYQQRNIELRPEGRQRFDAHELFESLDMPANTPYLSQIPCSWGAAYFPEVWREFHAYLGLRLSETSLEISDVIVPDIRSNRWPRSWKKYFIELVFLRGYTMLYPNYPEFVSFSTNHMEKGTHIHVAAVDIKRRIQFEVPLMRLEESILDLPDLVLPSWTTLPFLDLWGEIVSEKEVVERGWAGAFVLKMCPGMWSLDSPPTYNAREILCKRRYVRREDAAAAIEGGTVPRVMNG